MKNLLLLITGLIIGLYIGLVVDRIPFFVLDRNINIVVAGNLVFMVILAILIPVFLTKKIDNAKYKKELLISEIDDLKLISREIQVSFENHSEKILPVDEIKTITYSCKKLKAQRRMISNQIEGFGGERIKKCMLELKNEVDEYWDVVTGDRSPQLKPVCPRFMWVQDKQFNALSRKANILKFMIIDS